MEAYKKVIYDGHELMIPERLAEDGRDTLPNLIIACVGLIGLYLFLTGALT